MKINLVFCPFRTNTLKGWSYIFMNADESKIRKLTTIQIVRIPLCTAVITVLSQIAIPFNAGIPITLQTLAIALTGFILGKKEGALAVSVYLLLGLAGVPVFAFFTSGPVELFGITGGFLWGFIIMAFICGFAVQKNSMAIKIILSLTGLAACHLFGVIQFSFFAKTALPEAFVTASLPYILKDIISVLLAYWVSVPLKKAINMNRGKV